MVAMFIPANLRTSARETAAFLTIVRAQGAEMIGPLAVFPPLAIDESLLRFELEGVADHGRLVVGLLASPDL